MATCKPKSKILINRDCHQSAINAFILGDVEPVYIKGSICENTYTIQGVSEQDVISAIDNNEDAYELQINMDIADNENLTLTLSNEKGDKYPISLNRADKSFIIDRTQSGEVSFSSEFGKVLYSPLNLSSNAVSLTLFVDKSSVEALINDGMVQQTNLVYPSGIYNSLSVESGKGQIIKSVKVRTLSSVW